MDIKKTILGSINRVAETHFFLRPVLIDSLKRTIITEQVKKYALGCSNYFEYWEKSNSKDFFDMGTLIRLGTEIEKGLKYYYMEKKGHKNLQDLKSDPNYKFNIFQRVLPWISGNTVVDLFKNQLKYDLNSNSKFKNIQQIMLYRHLYAHNSGLLDDKFIAHYKELTSIDLTLLPEIQKRYPYEDIYYFKPLEALSGYIEDTRAFFRELP
jgi:hypothetical protein